MLAFHRHYNIFRFASTMHRPCKPIGQAPIRLLFIVVKCWQLSLYLAVSGLGVNALSL